MVEEYGGWWGIAWEGQSCRLQYLQARPRWGQLRWKSTWARMESSALNPPNVKS